MEKRACYPARGCPSRAPMWWYRRATRTAGSWACAGWSGTFRSASARIKRCSPPGRGPGRRADGRVVGLRWLVWDISERKRQDQALLAARQAAEQAAERTARLQAVIAGL